MATSLLVEEERGVYRGSPRHPHNGYWAGEFGEMTVARRTESSVRTGFVVASVSALPAAPAGLPGVAR